MRLRNLLEAIRSGKWIPITSRERTDASEPFEIGRQLSDALAAQRRLDETQDEHLPSPMADHRYSSAECSLWRWKDSAVDGRIEAEVESFGRLGPADRIAMRKRLALDDFYALLTFSRRCVLASLRNNDASKLGVAFGAMAMIEMERIDWRDFVIAERLASYAGQRLHAPMKSIVRNAIQMAEPEVAEALSTNRTRPIDIEATCGYREVRTPEGLALFYTSYQRFTPKADLARLAFEGALTLEDRGYQIDSITLAVDLPPVWLNSARGSRLAKTIEKFSGCVSLHRVLRADPEPRHSGQFLLVFLAEAASEQDALEIASAADSNPGRSEIALALGRIVAVIIQSSCMADTLPMEDRSSLERLRPIFEQLLT